MRTKSVCAGLLMAGLMTTGCNLLSLWNLLPTNKTGKAGLYQFKSAEELKQYLADQYRERTTYRNRWGIETLLPVMFVGGANAASADTGSKSGEVGGDQSEDYSTTNLQEEGVDESDIMKNDAEHVYALDANGLRIAKVKPAEALEELGRLDLEGSPDSLYLMGDQAVALSQKWGNYGWYYTLDTRSSVAPVSESATGKNEAIITLIDVSDRTAPSVIKTYRLEGNLVDSRMIDGRLHVVMTITPDLPPVEKIVATPLEDMLPGYVVTNQQGATVKSGVITDWPGFYRPVDPDGYGIISVVTINTTDPNAEMKSVALTADPGVIYASTESLYLTDTDWGYTDASSEKTIIHKFTFADDGARYVASGSVPGRPLNQFSLGEYQDYLRIATTIGFVSRTNSTSTNNVFVLSEGADGLETVGEVRNIAPGEQIYSARFLGPRGFLVTFQKIDPLFTLDLSDPANPRVVGELKVPGYSDYIHLLDENHLLTIGKDAEATDQGFAWYQGVQLSVFDIHNFAEPKLLWKEIIGGRGTESEALHNHKAFNFFRPKDLLAIPIELYEGGQGGPTYGQHTFSGLYVYRVTVADGIQLKGRISTIGSDVSQIPEYGWYYYNAWTRGVFIGDHVYAVTDRLIRSATSADPNTVLDTLEYGR